MHNQPKDNYIRGVLMIIMSAFCFACMNVCIRLSGDLPSMQKSFFRNLVAAFFAVIFSYFLLKEKILPFQAACIFSAFCGCLFIVKPGFHNTALLPALIGVCGGLGAGIAYTMVRKLGTMNIKGSVIVFYFSLFSCLFLTPWIVINFAHMTLNQILTLLMTGLFAAGGQFAITAAYTYAPAKKISIFDYSQIIFAAVLGFALFHELPDKYSFLGYALVIAASLMMFLYNCQRKTD